MEAQTCSLSKSAGNSFVIVLLLLLVLVIDACREKNECDHEVEKT